MKGIVLVVRITLVKPNVIQTLDGMDIIIQLKVQNHGNTFEAASTTTLHELSFQMLQKTTKSLEKSYIALWKPDPKSMTKTCERHHFRSIASCHAKKK